MLKARIIDASEKELYNNFVARHPKGHFLQTWEWGQVKAKTGWDPIALVLENESGIAASLLLLKRRLPLPGVSRSIFYSPRGPVADVHDSKLLDALFGAAREVAGREGAIFLKIDPDVPKEDEILRRYLEGSGFVRSSTSEGFDGVQPTFVFRLDITPDEETLLKSFHQKTRYNIRLAERKGVTVRQAVDKNDLKSFYRVLVETAERDRFLIRGYEYFEAIWDYMVPHKARIFLAEYEGHIVAGTLALILGDKAWYLYGASSNEYRNVMPNYLLQWRMIQWSKANGCTLYDFRGVSGDLDESNPLYGLYRFKKGYGGVFTEFVGEWDMIYSPFYYLLWTKGMPLYYRGTRRMAAARRRIAGGK